MQYTFPEDVRRRQFRQRRRRLLLCLVGCAVLLAVGFVCGRLAGPGSLEDRRTFETVWRVMNENWYWGSEHEDLSGYLMDSAIKGLAEHSEDPFTSYFTPAQADSFYGSLDRAYTGYGIQYLADWQGRVFVVKVYDGSSAEKQGLRPGDQLISVDGTALTGLSSADLSAAFPTGEGAQAVFVYEREGRQYTATLTSEAVDASATHRVEDGVGILTLSSFTLTSGDAVRQRLEDLKAQGCDRLILDLRGNGGGYTSALLKIAGCLLEPDTVVYKEQYRDGTEREHRTAQDAEPLSFEKIVILTDGDTASCSEMLTAALKEHLGAVVVGETTYGKGVTQSSVSLPNGSTLKYTISKWLSPSGQSIHGQGIAPDIEVRRHAIFTTMLSSIPEDLSVRPDTVDSTAKAAQTALDYLGYGVDRTDGYFSTASSEALRQFQRDAGLPEDGVLNAQSMKALVSSVQLHWYLSDDDAAMRQALEAAKQ